MCIRPHFQENPLFQSPADEPADQPIEAAQAAIAAAGAAVTEAALVEPEWSKLMHASIARVRSDPWLLEEITEELMLCGAPDKLIYGITLEAVKEDGEVLQMAHTVYKNDPRIVLEAVRQNGEALQFADLKLQKNSIIVLEAVRQNGWVLEHLDPEYRRDPSIVKVAMKQNLSLLSFASAELRENRSFILEAVKQNWRALDFADPKLQEDPGFLRAIWQELQSDSDDAARERLKDFWNEWVQPAGRDAALAIIAEDATAFQYADPVLQKDREILLAAARKPWQELQCMIDAAGTTQALPQKLPPAESKGCILMEAGGFFAQIPQWEFESEDPNFGELGLQAIELIMQSDAVRALFREAFDASRTCLPFKVQLVQDLPFGGRWSPSERTIYLRDNLLTVPADFISILIFELTNATRSACIQEAYERACLREISKEDFAKRYEEIEYQNAKTHLDVCKNALFELRWPCAFIKQIEEWWPQTKLDFPTFWGYWKHGAHTESYRQNYDLVTPELTEYVKAIRSSRQQFADRFSSGTFYHWYKSFIPDHCQTEILKRAYDSQYPAASACSSASVPSFEEFARSKRQEALPALISRIRKLQW